MKREEQPLCGMTGQIDPNGSGHVLELSSDVRFPAKLKCPLSSFLESGPQGLSEHLSHSIHAES